MKALDSLKASRRTRAAKRKIEAYERVHKGKPKERPSAIPVEASFDTFVLQFGGKKISDLIRSRSAMPRNADYFFPDHNVIAELKTLVGLYAGEAGADQLRQAFVDSGQPLSSLLAVLFERAPMPEKVATLVRKRLRRGLESRVSEARKQLRMSKAMFGDADTRLIILIAMDDDPIFGHRTMLSQLAGIMGSNYADEHTDGIVYLNPNVPTKVRPSGMEYTGWFPLYRDDNVNAQLSEFVNLLGNKWLNHSASLNGHVNPILELETLEDMYVALGGAR